MNNSEVLDFLNLIKSLVESKAKYAGIQEIDGESILFCSVDSPFEEEKDIVYHFSVNPIPGSGIICETAMFVFNDIDSKYFDDINRFVNRINNYTTLGSFRLSEDVKSVMFVQDSVLDEALDAAGAVEIIGETLMIMENTVDNCSEFFMRLLNGESIESLLESFEEVAS